MGHHSLDTALAELPDIHSFKKDYMLIPLLSGTDSDPISRYSYDVHRQVDHHIHLIHLREFIPRLGQHRRLHTGALQSAINTAIAVNLSGCVSPGLHHQRVRESLNTFRDLG